MYHVNVVYAGPGCRNIRPHRLHFLFARYFDVDASGGFELRRLDSVRLSRRTMPTRFAFWILRRSCADVISYLRFHPEDSPT